MGRRKETLEPENRYSVSVVLYVIADDPGEAEEEIRRYLRSKNYTCGIEIYGFDVEDVEPAEVI